MALSQISPVKPGDVIISEIMADPSPSVLLPDQEYLEITNRSEVSISLTGWKLISGDNKITNFTVSDIEPGGFRILCAIADTALFSGYGKVIGLKSFPALTDGGKSLILTDSQGAMIHCVEYSSSWYGDPLRSSGGWSLEMIDTGYPFYAEGNWRASISPVGGTPGRTNSVNSSNPDLSFTGLMNVFPSDSSRLEVSFSEPVREPGKIADLVTLSGKKVISAEMKDAAGKEFCVVPAEPFIIGRMYSLSISRVINDHAGNKPIISEFEFGMAELPEKYDIVFNELLFNPLPGDADYIELINNSVKPVDASWLCVASKDDATGKMSGSVAVSDKSILIMPGRHFAFTTDRPAIVKRYYAGDEYRIFEAGTLPSMPDDGGHLILMGRQLEVIDEVRYDDDMHFSLLSEAEGVSLEKVNPRGSSLDENNWHSSSGSAGWGTPGSTNSVYSTMPVTDDRLQFSSTRITPDNDGTDDLLSIKLNLAGIGNVVTVMIFDESGALARRLAENLLADQETYLSWDGTDNTGSLLPSGIYIFLVTMFNENGKTQKWKRVCTIIR